MDRRKFLLRSAAATFALGISSQTKGIVPPVDKLHGDNPRWYGFNLLEFFSGNGAKPFSEQDFEMMAEWKFSFARIPMSYWNWSKPDTREWMNIDESVFRYIDQVVGWGKQYRIHISLCLHRIPGYCVNNTDREPVQLFTGDPAGRQQALNAAVHHWQYIARRYKGAPSRELSFDLLNEPASNIPKEDYLAVIRRLIDAIREIDPHRRILAEGFEYGNIPIDAFASDHTIWQSIHSYVPMQLTHYKATWVGDNSAWPVPAWPLKISDRNIWDQARLAQHYRPWMELNQKGIPLHVGEWGVFNHTPHEVALAYMRDQLSLWKEYGWGWSLWNLRGSFGIMDSGRSDVKYESYKGRQLDRKMLEVLRSGSAGNRSNG